MVRHELAVADHLPAARHAKVTSKVALSRGWSLAGNHHGAMCGSLVAVASSGSDSHGRSPPYRTDAGRPWYGPGP